MQVQDHVEDDGGRPPESPTNGRRGTSRHRRRLGFLVGFLAAAGIYALEHHIDRLGEDHAKAKLLAGGLNEIDGLIINTDEVETNIVVFMVDPEKMSPQELCRRLAPKGVLVLPFGPDKIRAVTHLDISRADIEKAVEVFSQVMRA